VGFVFGGLQGALGWFMVRSGLVDKPYVSHYRLAAHLALALALLAYLFWQLLDLPARPREVRTPAASAPRPRGAVAIRRGLRVITALLCLQIVYGAFTAGLKAGFGFNTFPLMDGSLVPAQLLALSPAWANFLENSAAVQFTHRTLAWSLLLGIGALWSYARRAGLSSTQRHGLDALLAAVGLQFALGVTTLLLVVPVPVAALHQLGACVLLLVLLYSLHTLRPAR
jgi:cytochrome c oxidase assembly protein subunit 15